MPLDVAYAIGVDDDTRANKQFFQLHVQCFRKQLKKYGKRPRTSMEGRPLRSSVSKCHTGDGIPLPRGSRPHDLAGANFFDAKDDEVLRELCSRYCSGRSHVRTIGDQKNLLRCGRHCRKTSQRFTSGQTAEAASKGHDKSR